MKVVKDKITLKELEQMASKMFGGLVKATVDVENEILVVDAELHSDQEAFLLENGSKQEHIWGINIYPKEPKENRIEFDSMINLRPSFNNNSRGIEDKRIREKITEIVNSKISENEKHST
jgi:hypothetical protein